MMIRWLRAETGVADPGGADEKRKS